MRKFFLGSATLAALFAGPAMAADLAVKAPVYKAPPPVVITSWTGCYIGANGGWYQARQSAVEDPFPSPGFGAPAINGAGLPGFGLLATSHDLNRSGGLGGVQVGCNWQTGQFVIGAEGDYDWLNRSVTDTQTAFATFGGATTPAWAMTTSATNHWLASARARLGWAVDRVMIYATGGGAWTSTNYSVTATGLAAGNVNVIGVNAATSFSDTKTGWVAGGGVEFMPWDNWIFRVEYLHYQFGGSSAVLPLVSNVAGAACAPGLCNWNASSSNLKIDTVRVGLSYKFGGPVVARY